MKKIGLIGEAPNDTYAIENLLKQVHKNDVEFVEMIKNIRGSSLDNQKTKHRLRKNYERIKPDFVIFIRDLDGLENEKYKLQKRKEYFTNFNTVINKKGIYLLNIFEIEAIILSDLETFNNYYNCDIEFNGDPMTQNEPKEFLISKSKYKESDCPDLFKELQFCKVLENCRYFSNFYNVFVKQIEN